MPVTGTLLTPPRSVNSLPRRFEACVCLALQPTKVSSASTGPSIVSVYVNAKLSQDAVRQTPRRRPAVRETHSPSTPAQYAGRYRGADGGRGASTPRATLRW